MGSGKLASGSLPCQAVSNLFVTRHVAATAYQVGFSVFDDRRSAPIQQWHNRKSLSRRRAANFWARLIFVYFKNSLYKPLSYLSPPFHLEKFRLEAKAHELLYELHAKISSTASCWGLPVLCQQSLIGPKYETEWLLLGYCFQSEWMAWFVYEIHVSLSSFIYKSWLVNKCGLNTREAYPVNFFSKQK